MEAFETYKHAGCTIHLYQDDDPMSPREWTNLGVMACYHPHYNLGDEGEDPRDVMQELEDRGLDATWTNIVDHLKETRGATVVLPLAIYDHSGITMFAGKKGDYPFDGAGWDTSNVGFIFDTTETREECGTPLELVEEVLRGEVSEYDQYLRGNVCGYLVEGRRGGMVDSCWGFYDVDDAKSEAEAAAEHEAENAELMSVYESEH